MERGEFGDVRAVVLGIDLPQERLAGPDVARELRVVQPDEEADASGNNSVLELFPGEAFKTHVW